MLHPYTQMSIQPPAHLEQAVVRACLVLKGMSVRDDDELWLLLMPFMISLLWVGFCSLQNDDHASTRCAQVQWVHAVIGDRARVGPKLGLLIELIQAITVLLTNVAAKPEWRRKTDRRSKFGQLS